jgi:hypothetical protein
MILPGWWPSWGEPALQWAGAVSVWALALYVITRGGWARIAILAALAMAALVLYQVGLAVGPLAPDFDTEVTWLRATWPGPALLPALWLLVTAALAADEAPEPLQPFFRRLLWVWAVAAPAAGVFFAAGSLTTLVRNWDGTLASNGQTFRANTPGPLYSAFVAYVLCCALVATANLVVLWRSSAPGTSLHARFRWLLVTAGLFVAGGGYLSYASGNVVATGLPGHVLLIAGMVIMGWSIARYGALLAGEVVAGDFLAFAVSMAAVVGLYAAVWIAIGSLEFRWMERALPLLLLLMATHVFADRRSPLLERLLYGRAAGALRSQLLDLAARVVRQPDLSSAITEIRESVDAIVRAQEHGLDVAAPPPENGVTRVPALPAASLTVGTGATAGGTAGESERESRAVDDLDGLEHSRDGTAASLPPARARAGAVTIPADTGPARAQLRVLVEGALRHFNDVPALSEHPLLDELPATAGGGTALDRATRLRETLGDALDRLRPPDAPRPTPGNSAGPGGWLHYLVLHEAYVDGRLNKQIMQRYHLSEGTFHRARRRAIDAVTLDLHQRRRSVAVGATEHTTSAV